MLSEAKLRKFGLNVAAFLRARIDRDVFELRVDVDGVAEHEVACFIYLAHSDGMKSQPISAQIFCQIMSC